MDTLFQDAADIDLELNELFCGLPPLLPPLIPDPPRLQPTDADKAYYRTKLLLDQVHFAWVIRAGTNIKYVGTGSNYTQAILNAYEKIHKHENHRELEKATLYSSCIIMPPCPICDLEKQMKIVSAHLCDDKISVGMGNLFEMHTEC
jgi:hypothetical protein